MLCLLPNLTLLNRGIGMSYIPITQLRQNRKKKRSYLKKKLVISCVLIIIVLAALFINSAPFQAVSGSALTARLAALCTLILFGGILVGFSIGAVRSFCEGLRNRKCAIEQIQSARGETASGEQAETMVRNAPHLQNSFVRGLESVVSIVVWAFILKLLQPFLTAILWWQGYKLMAGKALSLNTIKTAFALIEIFAYAGILIFLLLFSWSRWNYYRYGRLSRHKAKPLM